MQTILNFIKDLNDILLKCHNTYEELKSNLASAEAERRANDAKADELKLREEEVKRLENHVREIASVEAERLSVQQQNKDLVERIAIHNKNVALFEADKNQHAADLRDQKREINDLKDALRQEQAALDADKRTYKEEIQKTIDKQLRDRGIKL